MTGARSAAEVPILRGRGGERAVLDELVDEARAGRSGGLVLRGEAGIGKTALLEHAIESAPDFTLLRTVGVESEMELAFAALHQVCAPVEQFVDRLPAPQRDALQVTFGVSSGAAPDRFLVALATLSLFSEAAQERPLLCVIDDAQWLDRASAQVLAFVARRLLAEPVALLFAARETTDAFADLPELLIEGLDDAEARKLLASVIRGRLDDRVSDQLVAEARGNPLALTELPRGLSPAQLAGGFGLPGAVSLQGRIEHSFLRRLEALPEDTQRLLLVAAAEPLGDPALLWRAAERLAITPAAREPAESGGLIEIDGRVRFRHPLVRSAVYRAASPADRRRAHWALAEATDAETDPDRRAWHLAEATAGPDEDVAAELERAAARARARGGLAASAAFLERAVELTVESSRRAGRALAAAQTAYDAGALDDALSYVATAEAAAPDNLQRARLSLLRGEIALASRRGSDAPPLLLQAAGELEAVDPALARATYLQALFAARFAGSLARGAGIAEVSQAALASPPPERPRPPDLLLQGFAITFTQGHAAGAPILKEALRAFCDETDLTRKEARWRSGACWAAADLWDYDTWTFLATRHLERARDVGALRLVPLMVSMLGYIHAIAGELDAAESLLDELRAVTEATGIAPHHYVALWVAALRGREPELSALIDPTAADALERGEGFTLLVIDHVRAVLYNGLGRYGEAMAALRGQVTDPLNSDWSPRPMAELVEAAVRCGERALAEHAYGRLAETTCVSGTDWGLGVQAGAHALLSDGDDADGLYRESIDRLGRTRLRVQLARAHLMYGEWLRRERRRLDAREQLRTAHEMFVGMGTEGFAARAERELLVTGERARKRSVETREDLTAQEAQIARLARDGLSNAAIGERLYISQHTVAYHLRKVFTKLDIASRHQLDRVLPQGSDPARLA